MHESRTPPRTLFGEVLQLCERVAVQGDRWLVQLGREAKDAAYYLAEELGVVKAISRVAGGIANAAAEITRDWRRDIGRPRPKEDE